MGTKKFDISWLKNHSPGRLPAKTAQGTERIRRAVTKHGRYCAAEARRSSGSTTVKDVAFAPPGPTNIENSWKSSSESAEKLLVVSILANDHALRLRLLGELARRLWWSALSYALFATLFSMNLRPGIRGMGFVLSGLLALFGFMRTLFARRVIAGRDVQNDGSSLIKAAAILSLTFGAFVAFAIWNVRGQVIPECLLVIGVAGLSSTSASIFAPLPGLNRFNVCAQVLPVYVWSIYAFPRFGWLLEAFMVVHVVAIAQTIRMNGAHIRQVFLAQLALETQSEDLRQARDAAEKAASTKMRFLANMSHEIRTPLNGILGLAEGLNQSALTDEQRSVFDDIVRSGQHLLSIVNDILDMAKVAAGKLSVEQVPFDLSALLRDIASPVAALAEARQLRFLLRIPTELPRLVLGDPLRVRQVASNLLSNAVKFTPAGEVCLTVQLSRPGWIRFDVHDTGIGLSPEQQESLFQEFHQVDSSPTRKFGGSGLGLAISQRLAELMGGRLWVESDLGEGSTFFFDLPLPTTDIMVSSTHAEMPAVSALPPGLRVLVAEDNRVNQRVMVLMLTQAGANVEVAENGRIAVERHQAAPYDVILMDCQMPELDGYEATGRIRSLPGNASLVPIIGVTANAFAEDRENCVRAGMNDYVAKPVTRANLIAAISPLLSPRA
jgi:signal transduction histidine kinase